MPGGNAKSRSPPSKRRGQMTANSLGECINSLASWILHVQPKWSAVGLIDRDHSFLFGPNRLIENILFYFFKKQPLKAVKRHILRGRKAFKTRGQKWSCASFLVQIFRVLTWGCMHAPGVPCLLNRPVNIELVWAIRPSEAQKNASFFSARWSTCGAHSESGGS